MSPFLVAAPEALVTASADLSGIGEAIRAATAAAAPSTTGILAAAEDEVSAAIAAVFSSHGQAFQALSAQAAAFHDQFVQALTRGCGVLCQRGGRQCFGVRCGVYRQSGADDRAGSDQR